MSRYRVLIVDDDDDVRRMIATTLRVRYETVEATDGLDALSKLEAYEPDLAIIDVMMPLMDGYQLCEALRRHPRFRAIKVLFLSAYGSRDNIRKGYDAGANMFLTKPIDPERLLKNIDLTVAHDMPPPGPKRYILEQLARLEADRRQATAAPVAPAEAAGFDDERDDPFMERPVREEFAPVAAAAAPAVHIGPRARLLLVDDDEELLRMLELALRDEYEVAMAGNGMEAVERMVELQPDLMLLDVMMPKMNGYQLLQAVRRNAFFARMPVVVLTAKSSPKDRDYATRLGATAFLGKPFQIEALLRTLRGIVTAPGFRIRPKTLDYETVRARAAAQRRG